jgi:hypothetical protein
MEVLEKIIVPVLCAFLTSGGLLFIFRLITNKKAIQKNKDFQKDIQLYIEAICKKCNYKSYYDIIGVKQRRLKIAENELNEMISDYKKKMKNWLIYKRYTSPENYKTSSGYCNYLLCVRIAHYNIMKILNQTDFTENHIEKLSSADIQKRAKGLYREIYKVFDEYYRITDSPSRQELLEWQHSYHDKTITYLTNIYNNARTVI